MPWQDITKSDKFRSLEQKDRALVKDEYFRYKLLPKLQQKTQDEEVLRASYEEFMQRPDDTGEGAIRSATSAFARGALRPLSDIPIAVGALTGSEGIEDFGKDIQGGIESAFPVNPAQEGFFTTEIPGVAGQVGSMLLGGGAGALAGRALAGSTAAAKLGAKAAVGTQAFTGGAAGGAQRADELGLTPEEKRLRSFAGGATELVVEALPFGMLTETGAIRKLLGETGEQAAKRSVESGWMDFIPQPIREGVKTEAIEEGFTEGIGQATDIAFAPEQANMDLQQIGKAMLLGGVGGAMFGGVNAAIAPKTAEAFKYEGEFVRVRDINEAPADVQQQFAVGDTSRLVLDKRGKLIGYKPAAETIEADMPTEVIVPDDIAPEIVPEVEQMVDGLAQNPTVTQTAKALAEDFQSGLTELPQPDMQANLLTGVPMLAPMGGEITAETAALEGQPIEEALTDETTATTDDMAAVAEAAEEAPAPAGGETEVSGVSEEAAGVADDNVENVVADEAAAGMVEPMGEEDTQVSPASLESSESYLDAREQWAISELTTRATRDNTQSGPTLPPSALESQEAIEATLESLRKEFDSKSKDFRNSIVDFYSDTSNAKTSNQAQSPPQSPLGEKTGLSPASAVKATESTGVGVSNIDDSVLSQWKEGKQPNGWVNVKSKYGEWSSTRNGVKWWIQAMPFNVGKSGKKVITNVVFAPSGEISEAKSFSGNKTLKELQSAAESVENASRKRQGKPLLKQVSATADVPTESLESQLAQESPETSGTSPTSESLPAKGQLTSRDVGAGVAVKQNLMKPYAAISVPDLAALSERDWEKRRDYLAGKQTTNKQERQELLKTPKSQWEDYHYNENARINEVASSLRAAIQDMQLARADLEKSYTERKSGKDDGGVSAAKGEDGASATITGRAGGQLEVQSSGNQSQLERRGTGAVGVQSPTAVDLLSQEIRDKYNLESLELNASKLRDKYYSPVPVKDRKSVNKEDVWLKLQQAEAKAKKAKADVFAEIRSRGKEFTQAEILDREIIPAERIKKHNLLDEVVNEGYTLNETGDLYVFNATPAPQAQPPAATTATQETQQEAAAPPSVEPSGEQLATEPATEAEAELEMDVADLVKLGGVNGEENFVPQTARVREMAERMKTFGFFGNQKQYDDSGRVVPKNDPILLRVQPDGSLKIEDGNHRAWAASRAGIQKVPVKILPELELPATEESTAAEPAAVEADVAGVAVQRDPSKPEQMTPSEAFAKTPAKTWLSIKAYGEANPRPKGTPMEVYSESRAMDARQAIRDGLSIPKEWLDWSSALEKYALNRGYVAQGDVWVSRAKRLFDADAWMTSTAGKRHSGLVLEAIGKNEPVSAESVALYASPSTLPDGYSLNETGDLYVNTGKQNETQDTTTGRSESAATTTDSGLPDDLQQDIRSASAFQMRLRDYITTLPAKAQAAWTPERLAAADSYYATGDTAALEPLTKVQQKVVKERATDDTEKLRYEAEQKRQFELRNPPPVTESEFLSDPNALLDSQTEEQLQQERERRDEYGRASLTQGTVEAYHGTPEGGWTDFKESERGLFFSDKQSIAEGYIYHRSPWLSKGRKPEVMKVGLTLGKNLEIDAGGARFDNIRFPGKEWSPTVFGNLPKDAINVEAAAKLAFDQGYDSITIRNVMDSVSRNDKRKSTVFVVKKAEQVSTVSSARYSLLRAQDGTVLRTGVESIDAEAARNSYDGVIPGVEQTWVGTTADFAEQFPDGYPLGDNKTFPESYHEALVAPDGRAFIFTDQVEILEGDVARAREYGTTPGVEAVKRTLRHESFAHRGFMALPHPLKRRFMDLIESGVIPASELDYLVTERGYSNLADWRDNISTRQMAAEEWLAHKLERMTELPKSGPVAEFLDWLRDVWDYLTGGAKPNDAVLRDTLRAMHKALGALEPGQRIIDEQVRASQQQMTQQDREYMAAVEAGDMEAAQAIVDEAAFDQNGLASDEISQMIDRNSPSMALDYRAIAKSLGGKKYVLTEVQTDELRFEQGSENVVDAKRADPSKGPIVIGVDGFIVDGRHRAMLAKQRGQKTILAYTPQNTNPITRDDSGNIIPPSQRFNPTTSDIRASRQSDPINNNPSFSSASVPKTTAPRNPNRMLNEIQISADLIRKVVPQKYLPLAEDGEFQSALKAFAKDLIQPYIGSIQNLRRLLMITRDPQRMRDEIGITPQDGSSIIPSILELAALKADKLGNTTLGDVFRTERQKVGSQAGQNLAAIKAANLDEEFSPNRIGESILSVEQQDQKARVDPQINPNNVIPEVKATLESAGDEASSNVEDGVNDEASISEEILNLGIAAEADPEIRALIESIIRRTIIIGTLQAEDGVRPSLAMGKELQELRGKSAAERQAILQQELTLRAEEIKKLRDLSKKAKTKKATPVDGEKTKEPKEKLPKPIQTAKEIIDSIAKKVTGQQKAKPEPNKVRTLYKQQLKQPKVETEFLKEALALGVDAVTAKKLHDSINLEIAIISIETQKRAEERIIKQREKELENADEQMNRQEKIAEGIINEIADRLGDPPVPSEKGQREESIRDLHYQNVRKGMTEDEFIKAAESFDVDEALASRLWNSGNLERQARETIKNAIASIKSKEIAESRASTLIYRVEEKLRQGSKDLDSGKSGDSINKAFRDQVQNPTSLVDFQARLASLNVGGEVASRLHKTAARERNDLDLMAEFRRQRADDRKAQRQVEIAQDRASQLIYGVEEKLRQGSKDMATSASGDSINKAFRDQVKAPVEFDAFAERLRKLRVNDRNIERLFRTAERESVDLELMAEFREKMRRVKKEQRQTELSEAAASRLIYAQEEELRQGSKDRETNDKGDSINKAFREQLTKPLELDAFISRLAALKVSAKTAERLYKTAERVAFDNAMTEAFAKRIKFLDVDSSALANFVNDLRRRGKLTGEKIKWRNLLSMPVTDQFTIKETLLERIKMHSAMRDLTASEQQALADALEIVWQKERRKLFKQMIKRAERKGMTKDAKQRIEDATPKLLEYINQGMLASDAFYKAVGEQYGWQPVSKEDRAKLEKLAAEMQEPGISSMERNMKQEEIVRVLQRNTRLSRAEVLSSFWVLSVLTGGRTQFDMAGGILSGALSVLKKAVAVATTGKDPKLALKGLSDFGKFAVIAGQQAYSNLVKPEMGILRSRSASLSDATSKDNYKNVLTTGEKLLLIEDKPGDAEWQKTKNKIVRATGQFMGFWERLMAGWDHITATATYHGTLRLASGLNPKMFDAALIPNDADFENAIAMAKMRMPGASRARITALAESLLDDGVRSLGREIEESRMDQWRNMRDQALAEGRTASYQEDPTGVGGLLYKSIRGLTSGLEEKTKDFRDKQREEYLNHMRPINALAKYASELGYILATQAQNILGVRFMRFTGNKLNELISYVPVLGQIRLREEGMMDNGEYTLRGRNVYHNQALGYAAATFYVYMLSRLDEPDEEKNVIVEGSWENLTPARKSQLMAAGRKPNTVRIKTSDGKELSFNYVSWPFAGWLAGFGSLSDVKRYTPDKWTEKGLIDKTMSAAYAGAFAISDISSLSSLSELFGRSTYSTDPTEAFVKRISKAGSNYVGGFMPKFVKDIDSWFDDSAYRPENTWQHLAAQMPLLRRSAGAPVRDIFYEPVNVSRAPWSRAIQMSPDEQEYMMLGRLNSRGIWLTPPNADNRKVKSRTGKTRDMTEEEAVKYMQLTGEGYKQMLQQHGERLLSMDTDAAARLVEKYAARVRERALKKAVARGAATVTVEAL